MGAPSDLPAALLLCSATTCHSLAPQALEYSTCQPPIHAAGPRTLAPPAPLRPTRLRVVRLRRGQQRLQAEQRGLERQRRRPLVLQDVEADGAVGGADVGVPHLGDEPHLGRHKGVQVLCTWWSSEVGRDEREQHRGQRQPCGRVSSRRGAAAPTAWPGPDQPAATRAKCRPPPPADDAGSAHYSTPAQADRAPPAARRPAHT